MMRRRHAAALLVTCIHAFAPTPPPRAPRQTKVYFFDKLAESIKGATDLLSGKSRMTEANTKGALRDIRRALLDADQVRDLRRSLTYLYRFFNARAQYPVRLGLGWGSD